MVVPFSNAIPWTPGTNFREKEVCTGQIVTKEYGELIVVFDGNGELSTKETVHQRRGMGKAGVNATFNEDMKLSVQKG